MFIIIKKYILLILNDVYLKLIDFIVNLLASLLGHYHTKSTFYDNIILHPIHGIYLAIGQWMTTQLLTSGINYAQLGGSLKTSHSTFLLKLLPTDQHSYMLKWPSPVSGPPCPRAELAISHPKTEEINCKKTDNFQKGYFLSFKITLPSKKTHSH